MLNRVLFLAPLSFSSMLLSIWYLKTPSFSKNMKVTGVKRQQLIDIWLLLHIVIIKKISCGSLSRIFLWSIVLNLTLLFKYTSSPNVLSWKNAVILGPCSKHILCHNLRLNSAVITQYYSSPFKRLGWHLLPWLSSLLYPSLFYQIKTLASAFSCIMLWRDQEYSLIQLAIKCKPNNTISTKQRVYCSWRLYPVIIEGEKL